VSKSVLCLSLAESNIVELTSGAACIVSPSHCLQHKNENSYADKDVTYAEDVAKWQPGWEKKDIC